MPLDEVLRNPVLRKALEAGEERVTKVMGKLLGGLNLPSKDDVASLRRKLEELEAMIDGLTDKIDRERGGRR